MIQARSQRLHQDSTSWKRFSAIGSRSAYRRGWQQSQTHYEQAKQCKTMDQVEAVIKRMGREGCDFRHQQFSLFDRECSRGTSRRRSSGVAGVVDALNEVQLSRHAAPEIERPAIVIRPAGQQKCSAAYHQSAHNLANRIRGPRLC